MGTYVLKNVIEVALVVLKIVKHSVYIQSVKAIVGNLAYPAEKNVQIAVFIGNVISLVIKFAKLRDVMKDVKKYLNVNISV